MVIGVAVMLKKRRKNRFFMILVSYHLMRVAKRAREAKILQDIRTCIAVLIEKTITARIIALELKNTFSLDQNTPSEYF